MPRVRMLVPIIMTAMLPISTWGCEEAPTAPPLTPEIAASTHAAIDLGPDDFDYEVIRVPEVLGATGTLVQRANTRGELVGRYFVTDELGRSAARGFLARRGSFETIHVDGARNTVALGINERGTVVGVYQNEDGTYHGFVYEKGDYATFDAPAGVRFGQDTWIWDVSATGAMTGGFTDEDGVYRGFILDRGTFTRIMVPGSAWSEGFGINTHGAVTGHFAYANDPAGRMFGFVYEDGEFTAILDYPGEDDWMSCSMGIGTHGETVGHVAGTYPDATYGYVWKAGRFQSLLRVPDAPATYPTAVSPNGTIAGYAVMPGGERVGFVARPN